MSYDGDNQPLQATSPQGRITGYGYDTAGQLTSVTQRVDPAQPSTAITVGLGYDPAGRQSRLVDGNANTTDYTYTPWGLPESTIEPSTVAHPDPADRTWTTIYDQAGQAIEDHLPGGIVRMVACTKVDVAPSEDGCRVRRRAAPGRDSAGCGGSLIECPSRAAAFRTRLTAASRKSRLCRAGWLSNLPEAIAGPIRRPGMAWKTHTIG